MEPEELPRDCVEKSRSSLGYSYGVIFIQVVARDEAVLIVLYSCYQNSMNILKNKNSEKFHFKINMFIR